MQSFKPPLTLKCKECCHENQFSQPYAYHAGFSDQGFIYNEGGNATLIWSIYDPYFKKHFAMALWPVRDRAKAQTMEDALPLSPKGDRWSFLAPARCGKCRAPISQPMTETVYYLVFPDHVELEGGGNGLWMERYIQNSKWAD